MDDILTKVRNDLAGKPGGVVAEHPVTRDEILKHMEGAQFKGTKVEVPKLVDYNDLQDCANWMRAKSQWCKHVEFKLPDPEREHPLVIMDCDPVCFLSEEEIAVFTEMCRLSDGLTFSIIKKKIRIVLSVRRVWVN